MNFSLLRRATLVFLALPLLIFLAGWLRIPLAVGAGVVWIVAVWRLVASEAPPDRSEVTWSWPLAAMIAGPAAVLTLLSGAGGWGAGDSDWLKHDTILRDLLTRSWPVTYESGHGPVLLVYYTAFYLPAALVGKLIEGDWTVASQALAVTMFSGIVLAGAWLVVLGRGSAERRKHPFRLTAGTIAAAVFCGFSGLDVLGKAVVNLWYGLPVNFGNWRDIEWWAQFAQFPGNATSLFWAPQHSFGAWLPLALALDDWFGERGPEGAWMFYGALALFWSPFAAVGLAPILLGLLLWRWRVAGEGWHWWRRSLTLVNGAGALAGSLFALYLLAHFQPYPLPAFYIVKPGFSPTPLLDVDHFPWPVLYGLFVGFEFAGLSAALWWFLAGRPETPARQGKYLLVLATTILLALPFLRYGYANDLVMRGCLPALFVLQVLLVWMFAWTGDTRRWAAVWVAVLLLAGGLGNTASEYFRHLAGTVRQRSLRDPRTHEPVRSLAELHRGFYARPGFDFTRQYLGSADSVFARHLAARRGPLAPGAPSPAPDF